MPTASRTVRKNRRLKREKTLAFRSLRQMIRQYEEVRAYAMGLRKELDTLILAQTPTVESGRELPPDFPQESPIAGTDDNSPSAN